jgi:hypothetical protein
MHRLGKDLPSWANQICSFNASHIGRHFKGQQGVPVDVTALSLAELLKRSAVQDVQVGCGKRQCAHPAAGFVGFFPQLQAAGN